MEQFKGIGVSRGVAAGEAFVYPITADSGTDESTLGVGTYAERSNFTPCP